MKERTIVYQRFHTGVLRPVFIALIAALAVGLLGTNAEAQKKPKPKKRKSAEPASPIKIEPGEQFIPTRTFAPGTVGNYFFPNRVGTEWTLRTIQTIYNDSNVIVRADTVFNREQVVDTARFSLQRLPLMVCRDEVRRPGSVDTVKTESYYYVDDSIAMTVANNSLTTRQNKVFLVSPLQVGNYWHDQYDDTTVTMILGYMDSIVTPAGRFDSVLLTQTRREFSDLTKFFAPRTGIIKTVFRTVGPGGHGLVIVIMEMVEIKRAREQVELQLYKQ